MTRLADLQRAFYQIVVGDAPLAAARDLVRGGAVDPASRMHVYAHAYLDRLRTALAGDLPKLKVVLGDHGFAALAAAYLAACPTRHWSLREASDRVADFLAGDGRWRAWHADLARLERARVEAFDAADAPAMTRADLAGLPPEAFADLRLPWVPSGQLVALGWAADEVWSAIEDELPWAEPASTPRTVVVWRRDLTVIHRTVAADEAELLAALASGASFAEACAVLAAHPSPAERAFEIALTALDGGLFRGSLRP